MDRFGVFVDAGYLLAAAGSLLFGRVERAGVVCDYEGMLAALVPRLASDARLPLLRTYWYDGARDRVPTPDHERMDRLPSVKLRLGRMVGGRQKGVDSRIVRDLIILGHERAVATAYLLGGDEDLVEGAAAAQDVGVEVILVGVPPTDQSGQSRALMAECDRHLVLNADFWRPFFSLRAAPPPLPPPLELGGLVPGGGLEHEGADDEEPDYEELRAGGYGFGLDWADRAGTDELVQVAESDPKAPLELDTALFRQVRPGASRERPDSQQTRRAVRDGFWDAVQQVRSRRLDDASPDPE